MLVLGPRRTLPALGRIAADQDWVVARFFVIAAVALRRAQALLISVAQRDPDRQREIEALQADVTQASADLYRTLGHPAYSVDLLGQVLHSEPVQANGYRQAGVRRRLGESLPDLGERPWP